MAVEGCASPPQAFNQQHLATGLYRQRFSLLYARHQSGIAGIDNALSARQMAAAAPSELVEDRETKAAKRTAQPPWLKFIERDWIAEPGRPRRFFSQPRFAALGFKYREVTRREAGAGMVLAAPHWTVRVIRISESGIAVRTLGMLEKYDSVLSIGADYVVVFVHPIPIQKSGA